MTTNDEELVRQVLEADIPDEPGWSRVVIARNIVTALSAAERLAPDEWEYATLVDEAVRTQTRPRGPRLIMDGALVPSDYIAAFASGQRVRRRPAGPWMPVEGEPL